MLPCTNHTAASRAGSEGMAMAASFRGGASHRKRLGLQLCGGLREALLVRERRACGAPARLLCASASGGQPAGPGPGPGPASGAKRGPVTWLSVGLVGAVAGGLAWYYTDQREKQMKKVWAELATLMLTALPIQEPH